MKKTVVSVGCALAAVLAMSVGITAPANAQGKTITLCWAAWDPANALVELSRTSPPRPGSA